MNLLDYGVLAILALFVLLAVYKGFLSTALSVGAYVVAWLLALVFMPLAARGIQNSENLYNMMLYYTEGSEYIINNVGVEEARTPIQDLTTGQINDIITQAAPLYPMGKQIANNVATEAFAAQNVTTLGDYFNQTIVCVFINILVFLLLFALLRLVLGFFINGVDYAWRYPMLRSGDVVAAIGVGLIRGMLAMFLIFMVLPMILTVLGQFDLVSELVEDSFFASFFYRSNFLLAMMPGTI